ncbi:MAG: hypothetical protein SGI99_17740 [Pseudomonadota bacterium]|nr:hypothetical protein [Pseudomonadota bacterium]
MKTPMRKTKPCSRQRLFNTRRTTGVRLVAAVGLWLGLSLACAAQSPRTTPDDATALAAPFDIRAPYWSLPNFRLDNPNNDPQLGEGASGQWFGSAIALDGDTLAVGALGGWNELGEPTGAVYIYSRVGNEWVRQTKLLAPDARSYDLFGAQLALEGDTLVVGAPDYSRAPLFYQGAAYVFVRDASGWHYQQTLLESTPQRDGHFGAAIALKQNTLAISSNFRELGSVPDAGAVYLFGRSGNQWQVQQEITAPVPVQNGQFGSSLLLLDNDLFVGANGEGFQAGAAYVFARVNKVWMPRQRLVPLVSGTLDLFGTQIAGNANRVLISSPAHLGGGSEPGKVIEWQRVAGQWIQGQTLMGTIVPDLKNFGLCLDYRDGRWLIGSTLMIPAPSIVGVELFEYKDVAGTLTGTRQISFPVADNDGYGLRSLTSSVDQVLLGLPSSFAFPHVSAGEVRIYNEVAQGADAQLTLNNGSTATGENFGAAIAVNSEWLLVGTPYERRQSAAAGTVFAYPRATLDQGPPLALSANDAAPGDYFGSALAWSNGIFVIGAPGNAGAVYHFVLVGFNWTQTAKWPAPPSAQRSSFGRVIAADANRVVVGAENENIPGGTGSGVAYVYERSATSWQAPVRLQVSDAATESGIGKAVAIDQDTIVLGAVPFIIEDPFGAPGLGEGAAYVFVRTAQGWTEQAKLLRPPSAVAIGQFGAAVAVLGDTLFVGAPRMQQVHIFQRQGDAWSWVEMLSAPPGATNGFGSKLSVTNGQLWVGAETDLRGDYQSGSLHRFHVRDGQWRLQQSFAPGGQPQYSQYATSFAAVGNALYVGAPGTQGYLPSVYQAGAVFVHELPLFFDNFEP